MIWIIIYDMMVNDFGQPTEPSKQLPVRPDLS